MDELMQFTDGIAATTPPKQIPTVTTPEALFSMSSSPRTQVAQREAPPAGTVTVDMVNAMRREQEVNLLPLLSDVGGQTVDAKPNIRVFVATSPNGEAQNYFRAPTDIAQGQIDKAKFIQMWAKYLAKYDVDFDGGLDFEEFSKLYFYLKGKKGKRVGGGGSFMVGGGYDDQVPG